MACRVKSHTFEKKLRFHFNLSCISHFRTFVSFLFPSLCCISSYIVLLMICLLWNISSTYLPSHESFLCLLMWFWCWIRFAILHYLPLLNLLSTQLLSFLPCIFLTSQMQVQQLDVIQLDSTLKSQLSYEIVTKTLLKFLFD